MSENVNDKLCKPIKKMVQYKAQQVDGAERTLRFVISDETVDRDNEVLSIEGWQLEDFQKNPVFLWLHQHQTLPIGKFVYIAPNLETRQLIGNVYFPTASELTSVFQPPSDHVRFIDTVYHMYNGGFLSTVSAGFQPIEGHYDPAGVWRYTKQRLLEISGCPVPANPNAIRLAMKAGIIDDNWPGYWNKILEENIISKRGRVLSALNEGRLRDAMAMLAEVLATVEEIEEPEMMQVDRAIFVDRASYIAEIKQQVSKIIGG